MIDIDNYQLKTDRTKQWALLEQRMLDDGEYTRKDIQKWKDLFWQESGEGSPDFWLYRFLYYSNPTVDGWQFFFDEELGEKQITDHEYEIIQDHFNFRLGHYFFDVRDLAYYHVVCFGEIYEPKRKFPFRFNQESECRDITLGPHHLTGGLGSGAKDWLYLKDHKHDYSILKYRIEFFQSLLPFVDERCFGSTKIKNKVRGEDGGRLRGTQQTVEEMLLFSQFAPCEQVPQERIDFAKEIAQILIDHARNISGFSELRKKVDGQVEEIYDLIKKGEW